MQLSHKLKLLVLAAAGKLPGSVGANARTRYLRRRRQGIAPNVIMEFERRLNQIGNDSVCIDLGANVGEYTMMLAERAGHVHAFEPDPWTFRQLQQNTKHLENVTLYNAAVAATEESVVMRRNVGFSENPENASLGTSILEYSGPLESEETFSVQCIDFRNFLRELGCRVAIVKVDIEGAEVPLLQALLQAPELDLIDAMFVETHEVNMEGLRPAIAELTRHVNALKSPYINLDWP